MSDTSTPVPSERSEATPIQIAGLVVTGCVVANIAFYFLSGLYFEDRTAIYGAVTGDHIMGVRLNFATFTGAIGIGSVLVSLRPRTIGHVIAGLAGLAAFVGGVAALTHDMTPVLPASLLVVGLLLGVLVWRSLEGQRAAWSFLIGMTSVMSAVLLFGATKIRNVLEIGLWTALIIPGLLAVATVALAMIRDEYREA